MYGSRTLPWCLINNSWCLINNSYYYHYRRLLYICTMPFVNINFTSLIIDFASLIIDVYTRRTHCTLYMVWYICYATDYSRKTGQ